MAERAPGAAPPACRRCPRLVRARRENARAHPDWWNAPVPPASDPASRVAIVGLAPGLRGANRTGVPFTGDASGGLLWPALEWSGLAVGCALRGAALSNAVLCWPPGNRPTSEEVRACNRYLQRFLVGKERVLALGGVAHAAVRRALGIPAKAAPFAHGAVAEVGGVRLVASYHPSRLNVSTGRIDAAGLRQAVDLLTDST